MRVGVNVPNFGPGTDPGMLRRWAQIVEGLGFDLLMLSDHVATTPDVAAKYPAPFYEPFTTLSWLSAATSRIRLGTTVLIAPYRHPLLVARMAANLSRLSGERLVLGLGVGWARQEFEALEVSFEARGSLTDELITTVRNAWADDSDYRAGQIPIWIGGNSEAGLRRAVRSGDAWHPLRNTIGWLTDARARLTALADEQRAETPAFAPRIALRLTTAPVTRTDRLAGEGRIDQVIEDLESLRMLRADTVVLDPYDGDPTMTLRPESAWQALATVAASWNLTAQPTRPENR